MDHNVIWNCEAGVRVNGPAEGHRIYNNTLFNCDDVGTHSYHAWPPGVHLNRKAQSPIKTYQYEKANNLFLGRNPQQQLQDVGSLKFWLMPGADAIDSGKPIPGFTDGFRGEAPDLGAYESGGARWVPGVRGRTGPLSFTARHRRNRRNRIVSAQLGFFLPQFCRINRLNRERPSG